MRTSIKMSEYGEMTPEGQLEAIRDLMATASQRNGNGSLLAERIKAFEKKYKMTSQEMRTALAENRIKDTVEITEWLIDLQATKR